MPINENWPLWIVASCTKHFDSKRQGIHMYVEGCDRKTAAQSMSEWVEFRIKGPKFKELSKGEYETVCDINVLVCVTKKAKFYRAEEIGGLFLAAYTEIPIKEYGTSPEGVEPFVECFRLADNYVEFTNLGLVEPANGIIQAVVAGRYKMMLRRN
jgi:hypothetical protein